MKRVTRPAWKTWWKAGLGFLVLALLLFAGGRTWLILAQPDYDCLNLVQRGVADHIVAKWEAQLKTLPEADRVIVDFDFLLHGLTPLERSLTERIFALDPKELGFQGPFYSRARPANLVKVAPVTLRVQGKEISTGVQYCPVAVFRDYEAMMAAMVRDLGKRLYIDSGYRSPGQQAYLFLHCLVKSHHYSLREAAHWVALPGYSEHGDPDNVALDFINAEGISGEGEGQTAADFENLAEYRWLVDHAQSFNFHLTYPKDNPWGVAFEPWHWHWERAGQAAASEPPAH